MERKLNDYLVLEVEDFLEIENWMINDKNFNTPIVIETATEQALELEEWITDANTWNK